MLDVPAFVCKVGGAQHQEEFSDFLLEDDDQGYQPYLHEAAHQAAGHPHVQELGSLPEGPDNDDPQKDVDGNSAAHQAVEVKKQDGDQQDIDQVRDPKIQKIKKVQSQRLFVKVEKLTQPELTWLPGRLPRGEYTPRLPLRRGPLRSGHHPAMPAYEGP